MTLNALSIQSSTTGSTATEWRQWADVVPLLLGLGDPDGELVEVNRTWSEYTGLPSRQLTGGAWHAVIHGEDREAALRQWSDAAARRDGFRFDARLRRADGQYRWHLFAGQFIHQSHPDTSESQPRWMISATDINEAKKAQELLAQSEERYRLLIEGVKDVATLMLDPEGNVVSWSEGARRLKGYTAEEIIGQHFSRFYPPEDQKIGRPPQILKTALANGRYEEEGWRVRKDGTRFWANVAITALYDSHHRMRGFAKVTRDFSDRKRVEEALRQHATDLARTSQALKRKNEELDQFAYITSHDLKAPLRGIANLSQWIEEDLGPNLTDETRAQMGQLRRRVHRMEAMIEGILQYSRIGRISISPDRVDVKQMLDEVIDLLHPPAGFEFEFIGQMPVLNTEKMRLQQVFMNLIGNAIKHHNRPNGRITITAQDEPAAPDDYYQFSVSDDGPGIDPRFHQKIFLIFQTLAPRDLVENTGVGLSLVKKIVEDQGGSISVDSTEGKGATFRFTWPKPRRAAA